MEKIGLNFQSIVLRNYAVYKKAEQDNILQHALMFVDNFLLNTFHYETIVTDEYLQKNKDIENYDDIKRLNNKYRKMIEEEINSRIEKK